MLLWSSLGYGALTVAVPGVFFLHKHLTSGVAMAATVAAAVVVFVVVRLRDRDTRRGRLAWQLLLAGPLAPALAARRTRRWQPVLLVRPAARMRL